MCIHRYKKLARFGLMHMAGTNICVWFRSIVVETLHEIHVHAHAESHENDNHHLPHGTLHPNLTHDMSTVTYNTGRKLHASMRKSVTFCTHHILSLSIS